MSAEVVRHFHIHVLRDYHLSAQVIYYLFIYLFFYLFIFSASEVTTIWRYTNVYIIIIIINTPKQQWEIQYNKIQYNTI